MKTEMKVLLYLKRNEQSADGLCPLMGKITVKGKTNSTAQFGCKIKVNPDLWNATSQRCTGKSRSAVKTNKEIESLLLRLLACFNELKELSDTVSATEVRNSFQGVASAQVMLLQLFTEHNGQYALRVGVNRAVNTYYQYTNTFRLLSEFIRSRYKVADVTVRSLDGLFIENFDTFLKIDKRQKINTVKGHINRLKSVVYTAVYKGVINVHPFKDFSPGIPERKQLYLTRDELDKLMNTTFDTPNRNFTRDMFLFSTFTGICYCDMRKLTEDHIKKDNDGRLWIETFRQKTGTPENVMLLDIAIGIIEKYRGLAKEGKLFPMLTKESMNIHLKIMAKQCGINRNLHYHMARHTFGSQVCLAQGVPIETVSRVMGHKNISTTQRYAKVTHEKVDRDISVLAGEIEGKYRLAGIDAPPSTILKDMSRRKVRPGKLQQTMEG